MAPASNAIAYLLPGTCSPLFVFIVIIDIRGGIRAPLDAFVKQTVEGTGRFNGNKVFAVNSPVSLYFQMIIGDSGFESET